MDTLDATTIRKIASLGLPKGCRVRSWHVLKTGAIRLFLRNSRGLVLRHNSATIFSKIDGSYQVQHGKVTRTILADTLANALAE